uniref:Uncharacterized protein n=1 Tax=Caenorhabditis japonica TaxID=281687 RepID=A0A8R1IP60_CAEJA
MQSIDPNGMSNFDQYPSSSGAVAAAPGDPGESTLAEAEYVVLVQGHLRSTYVLIDTTNAGFGDIDVYVDGPTKTPLHCVDNQDGVLKMCFTPKTPGLYYLRVMFDNEHVPGSPFQIVAVAALLGSGSGLEQRSKTESPFSSISSGSSPAPPTATQAQQACT